MLSENPATGDPGYWVTNSSGAVTGFHDLAAAASGYSMVGVGDFSSAGGGGDEATAQLIQAMASFAPMGASLNSASPVTAAEPDLQAVIAPPQHTLS